MLDSNVKWK